VRDKVSHPHKKFLKLYFAYFKFYIFTQQTGREKILNCMVASIYRAVSGIFAHHFLSYAPCVYEMEP
jgi:hypothetical protein